MSKDTRINKVQQILQQNNIKPDGCKTTSDNFTNASREIDEYYLDLMKLLITETKKGDC